jgi:hypothetical protein
MNSDAAAIINPLLRSKRYPIDHSARKMWEWAKVDDDSGFAPGYASHIQCK